MRGMPHAPSWGMPRMPGGHPASPGRAAVRKMPRVLRPTDLPGGCGP